MGNCLVSLELASVGAQKTCSRSHGRGNTENSLGLFASYRLFSSFGFRTLGKLQFFLLSHDLEFSWDDFAAMWAVNNFVLQLYPTPDSRQICRKNNGVLRVKSRDRLQLNPTLQQNFS